MVASDDVRRRVLALTVVYLVAVGTMAAIVVPLTLRSRGAADRQATLLGPALVAGRDLNQALVDQETGERGFVITGDASFLEPYRAGAVRATQRLDQLSGLFAHDPEVLQAVDAVRQRLARWRTASAEVEIAAARTEPTVAAGLVAAGRGRQLFDQVRAAQAQLDQAVDRRVADQQRAIARSSRLLLFVVGALVVVAAAVATLFTLNFRRWGRQRAAAARLAAARALADERERTWISTLAGLSERLNRAETADDVATTVTASASGPIAARFTSMVVVEDDGGLRVYTDPSFPEALDPHTIAPTASFPAAAAVRERRVIEVGDGPGRRPVADFADLAPIAGALGIRCGASLPLLDGGDRVLGAISVMWDHDVVLDEVLRSRLDTLVTLTTAALRRGRGLDSMTALADVSTALAGAVTVAEICETVARRASAVFGSKLSSIALLQPDGTQLLVTHSPNLERSVAVRYDTIPLAQTAPLTDAVRTGRVVVVEDLAGLQARYPHLVADSAQAGLQALAALPLPSRGRVAGAVGFGWTQPFDRRLTDATLTTFAELCGGALERAAVFRATADVADLAGRLAEAGSVGDVAAAIHELVPSALGVLEARLATIDPVTQAVDPGDGSAATGGEPAHDGPVGLALWTDHPVAEAIRTGRTVSVGWATDQAVRFPDLAGLMVVPLARRDERAIGALVVRWPPDRRLDESTRTLLDTVTELCGATLERAQLYQLEHELVTHLAEHLSRPAASLEGVECATLYRPALSTLGIGGDWFDIIVLDDHRMGAVVGDVVGHGVIATAEMAELRTAIATLVRLGVAGPGLFVRLHELTSRSQEDTFRGTATYAEIDTVACTLRLTSAGHPPAVVWTPDGGVREVYGTRHPVLGLTAGQPTVAPAVEFPPGAVVVLYTDGVVERRGESLDAGIGRVRGIVAALAADATVEQIAARIADVAQPGVASDDVAVVVLRHSRR